MVERIKEIRKQTRAERLQRYRKNHPEKYKRLYTLSNRKRTPEKIREHYERNAERLRANARLREANKRARKLKAIPKWADVVTIREIYTAADWMSRETGVDHHVDHIVPLISHLVCGLHCEANLQIISGRTNMQKSNIWWPDMPLG